MRIPRVLGILLAGVLIPRVGSSETVTIDHKHVGCVVAERFPRFEAGVNVPAEQVSRARLLFRTDASNHWYSVAMKREESRFVGILPKPKKSLGTFDYYIEMTDRAFSTSRTEDQKVAVVSGPAACEQGMVLGGTVASASVVVEIPAGAPALPAGFSTSSVATVASSAAGVASTGAAAAGGGISGTVLVLGGLAAAGTIAAVAAGSGSGGAAAGVSSSPASVSGHWVGQWIEVVTGPRPDLNFQCSGSVTIDLNQNGSSISGTLARQTFDCGFGNSPAMSWPVGGNASNGSITMPLPYADAPNCNESGFSGQYTAASLTLKNDGSCDVGGGVKSVFTNTLAFSK